MATVANIRLFVGDCILEAIKEQNREKERYFRGVRTGIDVMMGEKESISVSEWNKNR
ncbi:hypothetical protein KAW18_19240 [candidate division WOR-3 bacterium]|nr:hypothetical protein [candidate division WOR-3 bacterium]